MRPFCKSVTMSTVIIVASLCFPLNSEAKSLHITALIGQQTRVFGHVRFAKGCGPGVLPDLEIVTPPKLGKLSTALETVTLTAPDFGTCAPGTAGPERWFTTRRKRAGTTAFTIGCRPRDCRPRIGLSPLTFPRSGRTT